MRLEAGSRFARGAEPLMARRGGGSILTLTYLGAQRVFANYNVMGVAKAALEASVRYLASDLGPQGIRVNAISAGPVKTLAAACARLDAALRQDVAFLLGVAPSLAARPVPGAAAAPLRRNIETSEVADAATFLLGPAGRGITGEVLMVDAGYHVMGM